MEPARSIPSSNQSQLHQNQSDELLRAVEAITEFPPRVLLEGDAPQNAPEITPLTRREVESTGGLLPYFQGGSCPSETDREIRSLFNKVSDSLMALQPIRPEAKQGSTHSFGTFQQSWQPQSDPEIVESGTHVSVVSMGESSGDVPSGSHQPVDESTVGTQSQHSSQFWTNRIQQLSHQIETASPAALTIAAVIAQYEHLLQSVLGRNQNVESQNNTLTRSLNEHTVYIKNLRDALHEQMQKLSTMTTEIDQLKQEVQELLEQQNAEKEQLRSDLNKAQDAENEQKEKNTELDRQINELKEEKKKFEESHADMQQKLINQQTEVLQGEKQLVELRENLDASAKELSDKEQEILNLKKLLSQEKESSKQASLHPKTLLEDNQRLEAKLEKEAGENVHLKQELEQNRTEVSDLKAELSKQQALILTLQEQLNSQPARKLSFEPLSASPEHLIEPVSGECSSELASSVTVSPLPVEPVFVQVDVPPVIAYEPVASTSETVLLPGAPQNLEELFKRSEQLGIPQAYVALGYPIRKQKNGEPVIIRSKKDLGDPSKFDPAEEDEILNQIARDFCNGDRDLVNNYWYQASFLEYFYNHAPVISWHSLPHASFCRKIEGVRSIGVDKAHLGGEAKNLYSDEEIGQLMDWRNEQNEDEALKAFTPECWQPWEWLSTLAKAHRDSSGNKLMLLAGLWADFSLVMTNNACRKSAKDRVRQNKVLFDWRKLSDTPDPMAMHSGGQGETMQSKAKRKIPRGKTVSSKKRR